MFSFSVRVSFISRDIDKSKAVIAMSIAAKSRIVTVLCVSMLFSEVKIEKNLTSVNMPSIPFYSMNSEYQHA